MPEQNNTENSKRIAKNTLLLYFRMLFLMQISLYISSVILNALGVEDYGVYNVVGGGVVTMFSMLSGPQSPAISRFLTFEQGKSDTKKLKGVFLKKNTIEKIGKFSFNKDLIDFALERISAERLWTDGISKAIANYTNGKI